MVRITTHKNFTTLEIKIKLSLYEFRALANGESMKVICSDGNTEAEAWIRLISEGQIKYFELDLGTHVISTEGAIISMW